MATRGARTGFHPFAQEIVRSEITNNLNDLPVLFSALMAKNGMSGTLGTPNTAAVIGRSLPNQAAINSIVGSTQYHITFNSGNTISGKFLSADGTTSSAGNERQHSGIRTAYVSWARYDHPIAFQNELLRQAAGSNRTMDVMREMTRIAMSDMIQDLAATVYTGTPSDYTADLWSSWAGLNEWVDDDNNAFGVDRSTVNGFDGVRIDTTTTLSLSIIDTAAFDYDGSGNGLADKGARSDLWITDNANYNTLKQEALTKGAQIVQPGQTDGGLVGFRNEYINYNGRFITFDPFCPTSNLYGLDTRTWEVHVDPRDNFRVGPFKNWAEQGHGGDPDITESFIRLGARIVCRDPGKNIAYTDIS